MIYYKCSYYNIIVYIFLRKLSLMNFIITFYINWFIKIYSWNIFKHLLFKNK